MAKMVSKKSKEEIRKLRFAIKRMLENDYFAVPANRYDWIGEHENLNLLKDMRALCNTYEREQKLRCKLDVITSEELEKRLHLNEVTAEFLDRRIETVKPLYK